MTSTTTGTAAKQKQMEQDRDRIIRLESDVDGLKAGVEKLGRNVEHLDIKLEENFARLFRSKDNETKERLRETQDKGKVWISIGFGVFGVITAVSSLNYWAIQSTVRPSEIAIEYAASDRQRLYTEIHKEMSYLDEISHERQRTVENRITALENIAQRCEERLDERSEHMSASRERDALHTAEIANIKQMIDQKQPEN